MTNPDLLNEFLNQAKNRGMVLGLDCILSLLKCLGNPQDNLKVIHVAGTNGKGSVCAYLSYSLISCGLRVGTFTSPAVFEQNECFKINNDMISETERLSFLSTIYDTCQKNNLMPTSFEIDVVLACLFFSSNNCNVCIFETGMGGVDDATNVFSNPLACVFTSIGMDHMQYLGDNLTDIALKKSGIIKSACKVISDIQNKEVSDILDLTASDKDTSVNYVQTKRTVKDGLLSYKKYKKIKMPLEGAYQVDNMCLALEVLDCISEFFDKINRDGIISGITQTTLPGRFETICDKPHIIIDGCHNEPAFKRLADTLSADFTNKKITIIMGVLADKDYKTMLKLIMPFAHNFIAITPNNDRALSADMLADAAYIYPVNVKAASDIKSALLQAIDYSDDLILCLGTLSDLKDIKEAYRSLEGF